MSTAQPDSGHTLAARPNLFLVGAMKAGTTSLYRLLASHPDIFMSPVKEPNYFADALFARQFTDSERKRFENFLSAPDRPVLHSAPVQTLREYESLYRDAGGVRYVGEASPSYLHSYNTPNRIATYAPAAHIIVILRDPVERAYSHYRMDVTIGRINLSFEDAIRKELAGEQVGSGKGYLAMSRYAEALQRWFSAFPPEQVKVISYKELFSPTGSGLMALADWLQLDPVPFTGVGERYNKTRSPRFARLNYLLQRSGVKRLLRELLPTTLKEAGKRHFYTETRGEGMPGAVRTLLDQHFVTDIQRAEKMLGWKLFEGRG